MQNWMKVTLLLCAFGMLREIRPSEPFVTEFLLGWKNLTDVQLYRDVYPVGTYSYMALLVLIFLITDFLRFKPVIILSGLSGISVYIILLWTSGLEWLQASQFFYGMYMATEVGYLTYIYAKVDTAKYPLVSSCTRIAALSGRFLSGVSAQLLTYFNLMDYRDLNYITLTAQVVATFWAFWLPPVPYSIYFHRRCSTMSSPIDKQQAVEQKSSFRLNVVEAGRLLTQHARSAYSRPKVTAWSALYACALALFVQAQTYVQLLWTHIQQESHTPVAYNGAVEAIQTLFGAGGAYAASLVTRSPLPALAAALQGVAMLAASFVTNIYVSYTGYIVMGVLFHYTITLASAKIASQLSDESCFGLIFGINTLIGTSLQSLLTLILNQTLEMAITSQYYTISGLFMLVSSGWALGWIVQMLRQKRSLLLNS